MNKRKLGLGFSILTLCTIYFIGYFLVSEIYVGNFSGNRIKIRLFEKYATFYFYQPMIKIEKVIRNIRNEEFYAQTHNGASLPPEY